MAPSPLSGPKVPYHSLDGSDVYPLGTVRLQWEFGRTSETSFDKVYSADFNVIDTNLIQMVLGARWIQENEDVDGASPVGVLVPKNKKLSAGMSPLRIIFFIPKASLTGSPTYENVKTKKRESKLSKKNRKLQWKRQNRIDRQLGKR